jgi:ABC-type multidrug transport system ATPase subunit
VGSHEAVESIELRKVSKIFGSVVALKPTSLRFEAGRTTILAGHNGAGKSTLLSIVATLMRPTTGEVLYGGESSERLGAALRAQLGFAADVPFSYGDLTGRENITLQAQAHRLREPRDKAQRLIDVLGLQRLADRPVAGYSQGELRRLSLARALIHEPRLLLLDEPTSGLDVGGAERLVELLEGAAASGTVIVISTHDPWLGAQLGRRVVILERGKLLVDGEAPSGVGAWRRFLGDHQ